MCVLAQLCLGHCLQVTVQVAVFKWLCFGGLQFGFSNCGELHGAMCFLDKVFAWWRSLRMTDSYVCFWSVPTSSAFSLRLYQNFSELILDFSCSNSKLSLQFVFSTSAIAIKKITHLCQSTQMFRSSWRHSSLPSYEQLGNGTSTGVPLSSLLPLKARSPEFAHYISTVSV